MTTAGYKPKRHYRPRKYVPSLVLEERAGPAGFGSRLNRLRHERQIPTAQLGKRLKISGSVLRNYETGKRVPGYWTLLEIARFFNVSMDWLTGHEVKAP
jgi:ribosome-binding protein aMBF1 (putative translation factor)